MARRRRGSPDSRVYSVFTHPARARIVELLFERGNLGFTELKKELSVPVGVLYYHLDVLGELVAQDERRRYLLTKLGRRAYELMSQDAAKASELNIAQPRLPLADRVLPYLSAGVLFHRVANAPLRHAAEAVSVLLLGAWLASQARLAPVALFFFESPRLPPTEIMASFVLGWLGVFVLSDLVTTLAFKRRGGHLSLLVGTAVSQAPLLLFLALWVLNRQYGLGLTVLLDGSLMLGFFFLLQAWSLLMLATAVRYAKRLGAVGAVIVVLLTVYLNITFVMFSHYL